LRLAPFLGIRKLEQENPVTPDLHLLKCLELIHLDHLEEAKTSLDEYKKETIEAERHPLHLLALARLSKLDQPGMEKIFLSMFAKKYPSAVNNWLHNNEKLMLMGKFLTVCS
jgi:hypothetical protein